MADFQIAFKNTLKWEDSPTHPGIVTPEPHNGRARLGINSNAHPDLPDQFWTCDYSAARAVAEAIYRADYWTPLKLDVVEWQNVANKMFDMAVDMGVVTAAKIIQRALFLPDDGVIGPMTLDAIHRADPDSLLQNLRDAAKAHYEALLAENPEEYGPWRNGWLERAAA